ncbi:tetratricopeptide repeat protein [Leptotrichia hofstadii]|uniref:Sel1 repeat protein n=1 Tax=Leptotrichia hofstadii F0254 TaxID=634994 RepID=C9MVY5_9FUSO|nr:tetratricopeptide repeat protein [Leptotrichia hofstadii]EEX75175.1 Sel1 repeat protein [Leptotrichia hofstadii F0254]
MHAQYKDKTNKELKKLILINDFHAINEFGERYFKEEKYEEALNYFEKASNVGSDMAINNIGFYYLEIENNMEKAEKYFLKAMKKGNVIALNNLGIVNDRKENYNKAIEYYLMAIKNKCNFAYNNLGNLYEEIYQDYEKAENLYRKNFKETKDTEALIRLAYLYLNHHYDKRKAMKYLEFSSKKGNKEAEHMLFHLLHDEECNCK